MANSDLELELLGGRRKRKSGTFEDEIGSKKREMSERRRKVARNMTAVLEKDVFIQKIHARPIDGRYKLIGKIGQGGFGVVYVANDMSSGEEVALKLEHRSIELSTLKMEEEMYEDFQGCTGFPKVYWYGWHDDYKVMAFELLGPSLEDLFEFCERQFSLKTVLMVMDQLLERLEDLHTRKVLHRDIKPQNCLLGSGASGNVVYVTDLGIAEYANTSDQTQDTTPIRPRLVGTAMFASVRGHEGRVQSAKDDLESLGYMMVYFLQGKLPWQGLKASRRDKPTLVMKQKQTLTVEELCEGLPAEFAQYISNVRSMRHQETPSYAAIRQSFRSLARRENIWYDNIFDWTVRFYLQHASEDG